MKLTGSRRWFLIAAAVGLILTAYSVWEHFRRPPLNILLITLDTTRADHLGCYGHTAALTPALDGLARRGVVWERARTPAPLTLPTHASLFTGLYPAEHGLRSNGLGSLPKALPTLAERLGAAGYDTGAFIAAFVLEHKFGLGRGFAFYDDDLPAASPGTTSAGHAAERQRDGRLVVEAALDWLNRPRRRPFFCWVHFYDPHHPYSPRTAEFGDRFEKRPYDGEIAHVDQQVQRLLDALQHQGVADETLVIVVGDHGEGLGDHGEREHGLTLYDHGLQVPWIWAGPQIVAGHRISQPVCLIDLTPTLLDYLQLPALTKCSGRSLLPGLLGQPVTPGDYYHAADSPLLEHGCAPLRALSTQRWKYIRTSQPELYDLVADPRELQNLAQKLPDQLAECESHLFALEQDLTLREADAVTLSAKDRRVLSSLGYLSGGSAPPTGQPVNLPDIKRRLPVLNAIEDARELDEHGHLDQAVKKLQELVKTDPDYSQVRLNLADVLIRQRQFETARQELAEVLKREPENAEAYYRLGGIAIAEQQIDAALQLFDQTLSDPPGADQLLYLGQLLIQFGQPTAGRQYLERALSIDPQLADACLSLGGLDLQAQRIADAEQQYRRALQVNPRSIVARINLIKVLGTAQKFSDALPYATAATQLAPANAELRVLHGTLLMALGNLPQAASEFEVAVKLDPQDPRAKQLLEQVRTARP